MREHHWLPNQISSLFLDADDHYGLIYWYNDLDQVNTELEQITNTPK